MAAARSILGLTSLILVAGGLLFMFLVLLAGTTDGNPVNRWYFLEADTSGIQNAPAVSRWTYWNVCGVSDNGRDDCVSSVNYGKTRPARPLDPPRNFDVGSNTSGIPPQFIGTHYYYYMTRFMFAFMLIALFFAACALFTGILALCTRLGAYLSGVLTTLAWIFQALNAALMTAAYLKGRNAFRAEGRTAQIGSYAFGFQWGAFVCFFLATILFCIGGSTSKNDSYGSSRGFKGKRSKSTRSRGSFINGDKEYA